jgi:hypothetical protein
MNESLGTVGLLRREDRRADAQASRAEARLLPLMKAFRKRNVLTELVVYSDDAIEDMRHQLMALSAILVWVNPIQDGANRTQLDTLLREVSASGVWVSAHPNVIQQMGTKEVLFRTRGLGWGSDTDLYSTTEDFHQRFPVRLGQDRVRVLKQSRGNGGNGVWKVEWIGFRNDSPETPSSDSLVRVQHAQATDGATEQVRLGEFMKRCGMYFARSGCLVDQPFQQRLAEGMIRCYFVHDEVVGFCQQWPLGLMDLAPEGERSPAASPTASVMEGPDTAAYQSLKAKVVLEWMPQMKAVLDIDTLDLPVIWDADFLYGPKSGTGGNTYVLCEINVSAVWPFPEEASEKIVEATVARLLARSGS